MSYEDWQTRCATGKMYQLQRRYSFTLYTGVCTCLGYEYSMNAQLPNLHHESVGKTDFIKSGDPNNAALTTVNTTIDDMAFCTVIVPV